MNYKVIISTNHPVVYTYMQILKKACMATGDPVEERTEDPDKRRNIHKINKKTDCFVVDSPIVALRYYFYGARNFITWYQGIAPEESYMHNHSSLRKWILEQIEKMFLKKSKLLLFVSDDMLIHYEKKYKISLKNKSVIMPCFNETAIIEDAFLKDKYQKNTFLYAGGMAKWQCFDKIAELYSKIEKADCNTILYVYTFDMAVAEEILLKHDIKNYKIGCVPSNKLSEEIKSIKYGFVLREDCDVNNVATPTKFSNYLANGIIPIYSNSLHSFAAIDRKFGVGIVCNIDEIDAGVAKILQHMGEDVDSKELKSKCCSIFSTYYNSNFYIDKIKSKMLELNL